MMWMGKVSGIAALAVGAFLVAFAGFNFSWAIGSLATLLAGALLLVGGIRTLRQMSGGLRLLAGAWGLAAGVCATSFPLTSPPQVDALLHDCYYVVTHHGWLSALGFILALAGLALTVLHKEKKKP